MSNLQLEQRIDILECKIEEQTKEIERLRHENKMITASFRMNMMRLLSDYSHEEFDAKIAALKESE